MGYTEVISCYTYVSHLGKHLAEIQVLVSTETDLNDA